MKVFIRLFLILTLFSSALPAESEKSPLVVYTYDSFVGRGSLGEALAEAFKKKTGVEVKYSSFGSAGQAFNQVALEKEKTSADVLMGVDNSLLARARGLKLFEKQVLPKKIKLVEGVDYDKEHFFLPFDFGYPTFVYDARRISWLTPEVSLTKLAGDKRLAKKLIIQDPRASSLGLAFLISTHRIFGPAEVQNFWKNLANQIVAYPTGWSAAYGMFLNKQSDMVLSYTTSPAYHLEKEKVDHIRALIFTEGHYRQIEGVAILRSSPRVVLARTFVDLLLSKEIQSKVPTTNWMYPVLKEAPLPESFKKLPQVQKVLDIEPEWIEFSKGEWLNQWSSMLSK